MSPPTGSREPCGLSYEQLGKLSDEIVMAHLVAGHGDAIAILLDRYSRLVLSIAVKILRDATEAEDAAQEVFVDICRTAAQFDATKGTTKMWLVRTAYRRSLTRRRNMNLRASHLHGTIEDVLNFPIANVSTLQPKLSIYESQRLVKQILSTLDASQRKILELVFFEGLTLRDVAGRTGSSLESVRHRYYRSIDKLRRLMDEQRNQVAIPKRETIDAEA
jgi:RNA polymerase sigma-70 factor (ECF subfamily)